MLFSSLVFLSGFLPAVLLIYYVFLRGRRKAQNVFLLLAEQLDLSMSVLWRTVVCFRYDVVDNRELDFRAFGRSIQNI